MKNHGFGDYINYNNMFLSKHTDWNTHFTCIGVSVGVAAVHYLLMRRAQGPLRLQVLGVCVTIGVRRCGITSVCIYGQARNESVMCGVDGRWVCCGRYVMSCVRGQDPRAGGRGWIEVTGAAVRCGCCSYRAQSTLQTLVLNRRLGERQVQMGRGQRKRGVKVK